MNAPEDALALLVEHRSIQHAFAMSCECGWKSGKQPSIYDYRPAHEAHVAQVLAEWVAGEKARAWDEGAITALDFAVRGDDGIGLSLDLTAHPNPYKDQEADRG